jgi:AraC-like DNA-binding protein
MKVKISFLKKMIVNEPQRNWKVDDLAQAIDVSPAHLQRLFKTETGIPPIQFIKKIRLEKARELLETTFLRVQQIAFQVGINDQSYFDREFKKKYGVTPNQYRELHHQKLERQENENQ